MLTTRPLCTDSLGTLCICACLCLGGTPTSSFAQLNATEQPAGSAEAIDNDLDPTVIHSRLRVANEFTDREAGAWQNETTFSATYGFGLKEHNDWRLTLSVPVVEYNAGRVSGSHDASGLGDIEFLLAHVFDPTGRFRWGFGLETAFDTATEPQLGDNRIRLSPIAGFAWRFSPQVKFQTFIQYNQSVAKEADVKNQQDLELKPSLEVDLPWECYGYVEWASKWNLEHEGDYTSKFKIEVGHAFGRREQFVTAVRYEVPLTESSDQGTYSIALTYVFK